MVIKDIVCIILCQAFCGKIWLIITPMTSICNFTSVYFEIKKIISNICSEDSVANDYRFLDCGGWPLVSRPFFLFAYDVFDFLVNGLFDFLVKFAAFSNELPLRYVYG